MSKAVSRAVAVFVLGTVLNLLAAGSHVWSELHHRETVERQEKTLQQEADHQEKMRLARQFESEERGRAIYELHQLREIIKQTKCQIKEIAP